MAPLAPVLHIRLRRGALLPCAGPRASRSAKGCDRGFADGPEDARPLPGAGLPRAPRLARGLAGRGDQPHAPARAGGGRSTSLCPQREAAWLGPLPLLQRDLSDKGPHRQVLRLERPAPELPLPPILPKRGGEVQRGGSSAHSVLCSALLAPCLLRLRDAAGLQDMAGCEDVLLLPRALGPCLGEVLPMQGGDVPSHSSGTEDVSGQRAYEEGQGKAGQALHRDRLGQ
mmetsp:Transcript_52662/g.165377  ORF Transcript_52662/g.165377 Transcript_52662/m.165377 type:complete len:228 (+) Transcript_52662:178-861(+)